MPVIEISSLSHPGVEMFCTLTEAQLRNRIEPDKGIFIVESPKVITRALDAGYEPLAILCEHKHITGDASDIIERCSNVPVYTGERELLATLTGYVLTRGVLCAMRRPEPRGMEDVCQKARRIVVIDGVVDTTNIGAIFRSAAALGIDAVLLTRNSCDPLNRRAVRVSMGTVFLVPWTWMDGSLGDLGRLGFRTAAMALTDNSISSASPCRTVSIHLMWQPQRPWHFGNFVLRIHNNSPIAYRSPTTIVNRFNYDYFCHPIKKRKIMADNYLEKKYEEYKSRKEGRTNHPYNGRKTTVIHKTRRVFVTGGAEGIGKAIVRAFRSAGHRVAFCDRNEAAGKETALQTGTSFFHVDVSDQEALENCMQQIFKEWGDIDIIINNAGISCFSPITETGVEDFDRILSVNLRPVFITSRRLAIHRQSQEAPNPFGRIVNICSTRYLMSEPGSEGYAASKGGIYSLTHALALSLAQWHITVNSISPGWIETRDYEQLRPEDHAQHPSGRVGKPEDIARLCLFICQEENDFMNGENVTIDGGMTKKMIYIE